MPFLEASNRFIQLVLSIHSSESNAYTIWLQHGVVIRGGQIRPTSSNPEDYVVHDVMLWDQLSDFFEFDLKLSQFPWMFWNDSVT